VLALPCGAVDAGVDAEPVALDVLVVLDEPPPLPQALTASAVPASASTLAPRIDGYCTGIGLLRGRGCVLRWRRRAERILPVVRRSARLLSQMEVLRTRIAR
jgi:hypothetical protein